MEKKVLIEGMMCQHCAKRVQEALGEDARVVLTEKCAYVPVSMDDKAIKSAIQHAGYTVTGIQNVN